MKEKEWEHATNHLAKLSNGEKLSKKSSKNTHSFIKIGGEILQLEVLLGQGGFGKVYKSIDKNESVSVIKVEEKKVAKKSEYKILQDLGLSNLRVKRTDGNKIYTKMPYLGIPLTQLLAPVNLYLSNRKPAYSKVLPHIVYLYLNNNEVECLYQDESNKIHEKILIGAEYDKIKRRLRFSPNSPFLSSNLHLFSNNPTKMHFPFKLENEKPSDSSIPWSSIVLYSYEGKLALTYRSNSGDVERHSFREPFREKPKNFRIVVCSYRPSHVDAEDNIFYLYLNQGRLRYLLKDKVGYIRKRVATDNKFHRDLQGLLDEENKKPRMTLYNDEELKSVLCTETGLSPYNLSKEGRFKFAIDLCFALAALHEAGYAHLDLSPKNITVDSADEVHIIDFGFAEARPEEKRIFSSQFPRGTKEYLPDYTKHKEGLSRIQFDMIALKRVIYMETEFYSKYGLTNVDEEFRNTNCLLTQELFDEFDLSPYLKTTNEVYGEDKMTAGTLGAILSCALLGLPKNWYQKLYNDAALCKIVTDYYLKFKGTGLDHTVLETLLQKENQQGFRHSFFEVNTDSKKPSKNMANDCKEELSDFQAR